MTTITGTRSTTAGPDRLTSHGDKYQHLPGLTVQPTSVPDRVLIGNVEVRISDLFQTVLSECQPESVKLLPPYNNIYNIHST